jgi:hypothetical protein
MLDTTGPVSREVVITTGLFLVILIVGTVAFDLYTRGDNTLVLTAATVADGNDSGEADDEQEDKSNRSNAITGAVIGITGAVTASSEEEDPQIGVLSFTPHFAFEDEYRVVDAYDTLQKEIREFYGLVEECISIGGSVDDCIEDTLDQGTYAGWLSEDLCETSDEALFYDVTEVFSQCLLSPDIECTCDTSLSYRPAYDPGEAYMIVLQSDSNVYFSLIDSGADMTMHDMYLQIEGEDIDYEEMTLAVTTSGVAASFESMVPDNHIYLYKQDEMTISVESQSTFTTFDVTRDACSVPLETHRKFCVQSDTSITAYDAELDAVVDQPLVYQFALSFVG